MRIALVVAAVSTVSSAAIAEVGAEVGADAVVVPGAPSSARLDPFAQAFPTDRVPGRALVKLRGVEAAALAPQSPRRTKAEKLLGDLEERTGVRLSLVRPSLLGWGLYEIRDAAAPDALPDEEETLALVDALGEDGDIEAVTDDRWYRVLALPGDPAVPDMWHLEAIGMSAAWDLTTGSASQRIGVVDTGTLRDHVELSAKAVAGYDFISSSSAAGDGNGRDADYTDEGDGADCGNGYEPDSWHGSHVAGTILASANNGAGIAGLNWGASLVTARAMGKCGGASSDIMEGAAWMAGAAIDGVPGVGADKVSVMNLSLGGSAGCSNFEQDVVDFVSGQGVVFVAAAGNNGGPVGSPANCSSVITVAAHGPGANKPLAPYSSFGSSVEVVAPGGFINGDPEQGILSLTGPASDAYAWQQGTSMAAPHVAGAISLLQVYDPTLTRADLAALFADNGDACSGCGDKRALRVDLLLEAIGATPGQPPVDEPPASEPPAEEPPVSEPPATEPVEDDAFEPNDVWEERATISCGDDRSLVMSPGDADWFRVTVPSAAAVEVSVVAGVDLDLFVTSGPSDSDVLDASTSETGQETVGVVASETELGILVLPWQEAAGSYRLVVTCDGGTAPDVEDPVADPPAAQAPGSDDDEAALDDELVSEGTMTRAETRNGGLRGGCSQASASAPPLALLLLGVAAITRTRRRRPRA